LKNISKYSISITLILLGLSSFGQKTCVQVFSLIDSLPIVKVLIINTLNEKQFSTSTNGEVCFDSDTSFYMAFSKNGFFEKVSFIKKNSLNKIYLLPTNIYLNDFVVQEKLDKFSLNKIQLYKNEDMFVYHAKKSEKIILEKQEVNKSTNNTRQVYGLISGLNSIQTSSSGIGTEIGVRGLSSERSSNLNIRQNGYDISADALGYPDAYYVPPVHTISVIESVRGAGALQYGTQFGGMINYKLKTCDFLKDSFSLELNQTVGSFNFSNSLVAVQGKKGKISFYANFIYKKGDDWKRNSAFNSKNIYATLNYKINSKIDLIFDYTHYYYLAQQPGGLTDAMYIDDYLQSIRDRNWFSVSWNLPSATFTYKKNSKLEFQSKTFALIANRKALGFLGNITRLDPLGNREMLEDIYQNIGNETKVIKRYEIKKRMNILIAGLRVFKGNTTKSQGESDAGYGPIFEYNNPELLEGSEYVFPSLNTALFVENMFYFTDKISLITGLRGEIISTEANGYYRLITKDLAGNVLLDKTIEEQKENRRSFVLFSGGLSYEHNQNTQVYTNFSQNYRAINFNDLRISNPNFRVDPDLKDETGFNWDLGIRGDYKGLITYDVSLFYLQYNNRIGFSLKADSLLFNTYRFRSNISKSRNIGLESLLQFDILKLMKIKKSKIALLSFLNVSLVDGKYIDSEEKAFENKKVEFVPNIIVRTGITIRVKEFSLSYQYNFVSSQFTDATNSEFASNAISGVIPSYSVSDISTSYLFNRLEVSATIENVFNQKYFNKRAVGYPGPGIIASPPLAFYFSIGIKL
tara:strand:- start:2818 stop:5232 length:2415 start_codon:yes stop_codon:yes gene_type:complete